MNLFLIHPLKIAQICFFPIFLLHIPIDLWVEASENLIFRFKVLSRVRTVRPKLGVFSKMFKIQFFCCFITQLVKKLQQWSLYEVIEDILPIVLNTKRTLSDIWLLSYKQNNFGCFSKKFNF